MGCEEVDMARVEIAGDQVMVQIEGMSGCGLSRAAWRFPWRT